MHKKIIKRKTRILKRSKKSKKSNNSNKSNNIKLYGGNKIFFIFTTGIFADNIGTIESVKFWNDVIEDKIVSLLNDYDEIYIYHSDTLVRMEKHKHEGIVRYMDDLINSSTANKINNKIYARTFIDKQLDFKMIESLPHLVFDFAHILSYVSPGLVKLEHDEVPLRISAIYIGYIGDFNFERLLGYTNFIVNRDGKFITYIDKLLDKGYINDSYELRNPPTVIVRIFNKIKIELYKVMKHHDLKLFDSIFSDDSIFMNIRTDKYIKLYIRILSLIMDLIMSDRNYDINEIISINVKDFLNSL